MLSEPKAQIYKNGERDPYGVLSTNGIWAEDKNAEDPMEKVINIVLPEDVRIRYSMDVKTPVIIYSDEKRFHARIVHMASKLPGFYSTSDEDGTAIASMEDVAFIVQKLVNITKDKKNEFDAMLASLPKNNSFNLPKEKLYIKFKRALNQDERNELANGLRNYFTNDLTFIFDVASLVANMQNAFFYIDFFFYLVSLISITISFFLILVSFISNVKENSWEFGVLRAIGLNKFQMTRIYIFEATSLTSAAAIIGSIVGVIVAVTMILQVLLFTQLPFRFIFPTEMFCLTFVLGIITAAAASYYALLEIRQESISNITRGLV